MKKELKTIKKACNKQGAALLIKKTDDGYVFLSLPDENVKAELKDISKPDLYRLMYDAELRIHYIGNSNEYFVTKKGEQTEKIIPVGLTV